MKKLIGLLVVVFCVSVQASSPLFDVVSDSNQVSMVDNGYDALMLRVHLFRNAKETINVQTFILTNDECGRLFMYELIQAAKRGVKVRMIADHFVSDKDQDLAAFIATAHPNLEFKYYRPAADRLKSSTLRNVLNMLLSFRGTNQRMHNKIITVDGQLALTGGRNIENTYYSFSTGINFKDRDVLVTGPVVQSMEKSFEEFWDYRHSVLGSELTDVKKRIESGAFPKYSSWNDFAFNGLFDELSVEADQSPLIQDKFVAKMRTAKRVEFICDRPGKNRRLGLAGDGAITERLREELSTLRHQLIMQTPYLVIDKSGREFFLELKKKAPKAKVIVSSNSFGAADHLMTYSANYKWRIETGKIKPTPGCLPLLQPY